MLYCQKSGVRRKIPKTVGSREKTNFCPPPFGRCLPCLLWLLSWHTVHRQSGGHSAKIGALRGGLERGDVGACCKPNRGRLVRGITFCVCCAPPNPSFLLLFVQFRECMRRRTLPTLSTIAHLLACVERT
jgi:hypothetical protein